ncbi:hypothetical protein Pmani_005157 [Petrolisthes manimaculis]|uniref:G-protein coupled receptors family 1 profile domain-containing protein n=1 Tax=Petrolisthes manimaculis TaxID=1843537 RepID=A0AAE1UN59_9EUCA|nr:hypothetical protein Pmani_005157 [Petrolisthes manimaculis]
MEIMTNLEEDQVTCIEWAFEKEVTALLRAGTLVLWFKALVSVLNTILALVAAVGCLTTLFILCSIREQSRRTASLVGSLVVSDLFTVTFLLVFDLPHLWNDHFNWLLGAATCRVAAFLQAAAILANSAALVAISVDRHLAIVYAHRQFGSEWRSNHIIMFLIFLLLFSFGVSSPYLAFYELDGPYLGYSLLNNDTLDYITCPDYFCLSVSPYLQPFQIALVCVIFLPLLVIFCVCYLGLIQFLRHKPIVGTTERRQRAKKRKVLVTLSCVTVTFLVCRLPSWVLLLVPQPHNQFHTSRRLALSYTHFSLHSLTLLAPALNPFLYALFQQSYRHHLLGCCTCVCCCSSSAEPVAQKEVLPATTTNTITTQPSNATLSSGSHTLWHISSPTRRNFNSSPSTQYYQSLAALLPPLLSYPSSNSPKLIRSSRIDEGGVLPFVPCTIMPYHTSSSISACFTHKLATHSSFHIHFMGDSKIRELFYAFLERIDEKLHFSIKLGNEMVPFLGLDDNHPKLKKDMEATSSAAQGLRVGFSFRGFYQLNPNIMRESPEVKQLERWASGEDTPPHLLIIGYTSWLLQWVITMPFMDLLSLLMEVHHMVVPLLYKISQRTHVMVVPQHRTRNYDKSRKFILHQSNLLDINFDLSEMAFRHYLDRWSRGEGDASPPPRRQVSPPPVFMSRISGMDSTTPSDARTHHNTTWDLVVDEDLNQHVTENEEMGQYVAAEGMVQYVAKGEEVVQHVVGEKVVQQVTEGVEVVKHVTEGMEVVQHVTEGEEVVKHVTEGEEVVKHVTEGEEVVKHVTESEEVVQHVAADGVDQLTMRESEVGVWWWDTSLPLGLASIAECQQLYHLGLTSYPLYKNKFLKCTDRHHAGTVTLGDQVTMLLNFLCNSVFSVPKNACCH